MIDRIAYDEEMYILTVTFRENGKYLYYDVPAAVFDAFSKAPSAGSFFNAHVKDQFRCRRDPKRKRFGPST
ncbi:MAG: KTSC domain-containing protein [Sphingomonadaceae bacterium]|nr:KTSC domain-containing protein [Sphingomonadaceae bacterium]